MHWNVNLLFESFIFILGLCIGSFINVVVYRMPKMLYFNWFIQCYEHLQLQPLLQKAPKFNLSLCFPRSHCPSCKHVIAVKDNIPIVSYLLLKGKCRNCKQKIDLIYPITEAIVAICSLIVSCKFGIKIETLFALLITWTLILQAGIDFREYLIPDEITLPMLWIGLIINKFNFFIDLPSAVLGAVIGYLIFWIVYWIFKLITGKEGIGYGDFKVLAMLGAWFGYQSLPSIVFISSAVGSLVGGILIFFKKLNKDVPIPFSPYLAIAGWITMLWGTAISNWYWQ